jgi:hypothetical protein
VASEARSSGRASVDKKFGVIWISHAIEARPKTVNISLRALGLSRQVAFLLSDESRANDHCEGLAHRFLRKNASWQDD